MNAFRIGLCFYFILSFISYIPKFTKDYVLERFPYALMIAFFLISIAISFSIRFQCHPFVRRIAEGGISYFAVAALSVLALVKFPQTRLVEHPSTSPDALIEPARLLFSGQNPYLARLFDGAFVSPGPGWIMLNAPLTLTGGVALVTPFWMALCVWRLSRASPVAAGIFTGLSFLPLGLVLTTCSGSDLYGVSFALLFLCLIASDLANRPRVLMCLSVIAGFVATARAPMIAALPVIGLGLWRLRPAQGTVFLTFSMATALLLHAAFYAWSLQLGQLYQPLHVFMRGQRAMGPVLLLFGIVAELAIAYALWRKLSGVSWTWMAGCWSLLAPPFALVGFSELFKAGPISLGALQHWEGSNYLSFTLPLLAGALSIGIGDDSEARLSVRGGGGSPSRVVT